MGYAHLPPPLYGVPRREQRLPATLGQYREAEKAFAARLALGVLELVDSSQANMGDMGRVLTGAIMAAWSVGAEYARDQYDPPEPERRENHGKV